MINYHFVFKMPDFGIVLDVLDFFFVLDLSGNISQLGILNEKLLNSCLELNDSLLANLILDVDNLFLDLDRNLNDLSIVLGLRLRLNSNLLLFLGNINCLG